VGDDLVRWTSLEERHEVTVIHALEVYVHEKAANNKNLHGVSDLPTKSEFVDFLVKFHSTQVLKKRIMLIENIIQNVNIFY
jgi:hypothetical protein